MKRVGGGGGRGKQLRLVRLGRRPARRSRTGRSITWPQAPICTSSNNGLLGHTAFGSFRPILQVSRLPFHLFIGLQLATNRRKSFALLFTMLFNVEYTFLPVGPGSFLFLGPHDRFCPPSGSTYACMKPNRLPQFPEFIRTNLSIN